MRPLRSQHLFLLLASLWFYTCWNPYYLPILLISMAVSYSAALLMERRPQQRRLLLMASLATDLSLLGFFKYADFVLSNLHLSPLGLPLPLGISFFTFHTMSYIIDVYRGQQPAERSLVKYGTYVAFFPQLVAGPIVRARQFLPQLLTRPTIPSTTASAACNRILLGLVKKMMLADWLAALVDPVFRFPSHYDGFTNAIALYAYACQIYCDFSGYCDIAIGSGLLLGIRLPENFNRPYLAADITDFWRRWHMTLSAWLRDYLYIPLGGSRHGAAQTYRNLLVTMLLGGLWHGAGWNFVAWGGLHGLYLAAHRRFRAVQLPRALAVFCTFHLVCFAWIFFRCESFARGAEMARALCSLALHPLQLFLVLGSGAALLPLGWLASGAARRLVEMRAGVGYSLLVAVILTGLCLLCAPGTRFIYFEF